MKRFLSAVLVAGLAALPAAGQKAVPKLKKRESAPAGNNVEDAYRIRAYTKLVQVPVIVTRSGQHVRGLKKEDFSILEGETPRPIATFEEVIPTTEKFLPAQKPGEYTNVPGSVAQAPRPIVIIALDVANSPFMNQQQGRLQLIKYLEEKIEAGSLFSLVAFSRGKLVTVHELTSDPRVLVAALKGMKSSAAFAGGEAAFGSGQSVVPSMVVGSGGDVNAIAASMELARVETDRLDALAENQDPMFGELRQAVIADGVFDALNSLAKSYAGIPGRKSLFWVSSWFPQWRDGRSGISSSDWSGTYLKTMEALNDANISVYPVDSRGLIAPAGFSTDGQRMTMAQVKNPFGHVNGSRMNMGTAIGGRSRMEISVDQVSRNRPEESARDIAELTGGRAFYGANDLVGAFRKADEDAHHYYMLGYYLPANETVKPGRKVLRVVVDRPGVKVRGRNRMFIAPVGQRMDDVKAAVLSPLEFTTLPVMVKFDPGQSVEKADFTLSVHGRDVELEEASNRVAVDFLVISRDPSGMTRDIVGKTLDGKVDNAGRFHEIPINLYEAVKLPQNGGTVRFIVRDRVSGKIGSVIVEVP